MKKDNNLNKNAIHLLSGGIDSATMLAIAKAENYCIYALSFSYGQRHACELNAAQKIAKIMNVQKHLILDIDLSNIGGSALTNDIPVPKNRLISFVDQSIPITYVPARNTIFLSFALAWAEVLEVFDIFIGVNAIDYSGYPDCRPEFISAYENMANIATKSGIEGKKIKIHTPLINMNKAQIISRGNELGVDYSLTHSCYDPDSDRRACGSCDSCRLRKKGFHEAGLSDPTVYQ
jgi:7-cyano-7-deazaguanine synthase